ncbi:MAG: cytochrome c oxidase subunit 3, partial [Gammaproteobacteria bacterium]
MTEAHGGYYVPHKAYWPIVGSVGLTTLMVGFASLLEGHDFGGHMMIAGAVIVAIMMFGWFGTVIRENLAGLYSEQVDRSFRWGMGWFIFSEVMFFSAFFGALFYARIYSVPWLGGLGAKGAAHTYLWPHFTAVWPTNGPGAIGGAFESMPAWGIPAINTLILLTSSVTVTWAHWALKAEQRGRLIFWLLCTVLLGASFL